MKLPRRRRAVLAAMAGLLAWSAYGCAVEVYRCGWIRWHDPYEKPSRWRFHSAHVGALRGFATSVREHLPAGTDGAPAKTVPAETVPAIPVFADPGTPRESFFRYLWLAYFLPEHDLRFAGPGGPPPADGYWIAFGERAAAPPRAAVVAQGGGAALYRAGPEGGGK